MEGESKGRCRIRNNFFEEREKKYLTMGIEYWKRR